MPLIGSYIIPNNPLLLPGLSDSVKSKTLKIRLAVKDLVAKITMSAPDVILVVTQSEKPGVEYKLLLADKREYKFNEWGDLSTVGELICAKGETHRLKESLETKFNLPLVNDQHLSYRLTVAHNLLGITLKEVPIIHLTIPIDLDYDDMLKLTSYVLDYVQDSKQRIVVVAAGDLGSYQPGKKRDAQVFDQYFINYLQKNDLTSLYNVQDNLKKYSNQTIWSPSVFLLGMLMPWHFVVRVTSYDHSMNIGWLTAEVELNN